MKGIEQLSIPAAFSICILSLHYSAAQDIVEFLPNNFLSKTSECYSNHYGFGADPFFDLLDTQENSFQTISKTCKTTYLMDENNMPLFPSNVDVIDNIRMTNIYYNDDDKLVEFRYSRFADNSDEMEKMLIYIWFDYGLVVYSESSFAMRSFLCLPIRQILFCIGSSEGK